MMIYRYQRFSATIATASLLSNGYSAWISIGSGWFGVLPLLLAFLSAEALYMILGRWLPRNPKRGEWSMRYCEEECDQSKRKGRVDQVAPGAHWHVDVALGKERVSFIPVVWGDTKPYWAHYSMARKRAASELRDLRRLQRATEVGHSRGSGSNTGPCSVMCGRRSLPGTQLCGAPACEEIWRKAMRLANEQAS